MSIEREGHSASEGLPIMKVEMGLGPDLLPFLAEIEESGVHANFGKQVHAMEAEFAALIGVPSSRVVSVANATLGLQGAMSLFEPSLWVVPSWTFAATAHAARMQSVGFLFGDVLKKNWALNPDEVHEGEGAVVTAPFGAPLSVGKEWNHVSALVIDAAAAIGALPTILPDFARPWAIVISLHATKLLGVGEGGLVVLSSDSLATSFRQWTNFGFFGSREAKVSATNGKLSEVAAAIARFRLRNWNRDREELRLLRSKVHHIGGNLGINPSISSNDWISPYWIVEFAGPEDKSRAIQELANSGVETRDWWSAGCHAMQAFRSIPARSQLHCTKDLASRSLGLPYFRGVSDSDLERVSDALGRILEKS
ncbi:MAG: DegT/DnrJ/EryC1/StrS family aminotransferase [Pontimonas sp.]